MNSNTIEEMKDSVDKITSIFQVLDTNGRSLLLPVLDIDKYKDTIVLYRGI